MPYRIDELINAIEYMYLNRNKVKEYSDNALRISEKFCKRRWEKSITEIIKKVYGV